MKKLVFGILIFAVVAVLVTGVLITLKLNKNENIDNASGDKGGETIVLNNEKTLDLYGTYDENDIEIEEVLEVVESINKEVEIPVIKGLKNKNVENKINADMKKRITEKLIEFFNKNGDIGSQYIYVGANFANVISINWSINYYKENYEDKTENVTLNYELINGERLNFEDLFIKDADLYTIARKAFYRIVAKSQVTYGGMDDFYDIHYDEKNEIWVGTTFSEVDEITGDYYEVEKEYIPNLTDYDINKMMTEFINESKKDFYFTPSKIFIINDVNSYSCCVEFEDIAEDIVIYDKYLTKESLYETSDIGNKNIWTCAIPTGSHFQYGFAEDNFYYDIIMNRNEYLYEFKTDYPFKDSIKKLEKKIIELGRGKIEEYRKIAKENSDKFYAVLIELDISCDVNEPYNILLSSKVTESIGIENIVAKKEIMDKIIECYRYNNVGMYYSGLNLAFYGNYLIDINDTSWKNLEKKTETKVYDARNLKEITSISEVFKEDVDYMSIIENLLRSELIWREKGISNERLIQLMENSTYSLRDYGIEAKVPGFDYDIILQFRDMDKSLLKIYDLDMYIIFESSTRKIEKSEILNLSLDELNKAYNEIFARHGHDFKNAELKAYFNGLSWYEPIANKTVSLNELSEIERYNLDVIKNVISEKKL